MKLNNKLVPALLLAGGVFLTAGAQAGSGHDDMADGHKMSGHSMSGGHDMSGHDMGGSTQKMFLEKKDINGYTVSFHVMAAQKGMEHGGSHNLMIKVEKGGKALGDLQANSKVVYPGGKDESKPLMKMGDWYMAGYDLGKQGKHQLMTLFKTADGSKHFGGVFYSAN